MIARAGSEGDFTCVTASRNLAKYVIDFGHREYEDPNTYEVLCGRRDAVQWVSFSSGNGATEKDVIYAQSWRPVELGRDSDGRLWFVGLAPEPHVLVPGNPLPCKIQDGTNVALFFDEVCKPKTTKNFQMLVHKDLSAL